MLLQTIDSLVRQRNHGVRYEIVVIDDGSTDTTREVVEKVRRNASVDIRYTWQVNSGVGRARNRAVAEAKAPWIAFIDDDEIATDEWLYELLSTAENTGADCVGGPCISKLVEKGTIEPVGTVSMLLGHNPTMMGDDAKISPFTRLRFRITRMAVPGSGNVLLRRSLFNDLGGFRPIGYGEDLEFFRRAQTKQARFSIAQRAIIEHLIPPERLQPSYLYAYARRGGMSQAFIDGPLRRHIIALLRLAYMLLFTLPALLLYSATGRNSHAISKRCSVIFATAYLLGVIRRRGELETLIGPKKVSA